MAAASNFTTSTIAVGSSSGAQPQVKVASMPDGSVVLAHAFVDASETLLDPAKDSTVQTATAAILAAAVSLTSTIPPVDAFGGALSGTAGYTDAFGNPLS